MKSFTKFLIVILCVIFPLYHSAAQSVWELEELHHKHCGKNRTITTPIKNQSNPKLEYIVQQQNTHLIRSFLQFQIEETETELYSNPNVAQSKALLESTFGIYKELFPPSFTVFKAFIDTVYRHILDLAMYTSNQQTQFYKLKDADHQRLVDALEECHGKTTHYKLKLYYDHCNEKVLSIGCPDEFICQEQCGKNLTSFDPILKTYINVINTISNHCFKSLEKPKTQLLHGWKLALLDLVTEQAKFRWSYNNEKLSRWIALLGPTFKTNLEMTTSVATYMMKNSIPKFYSTFEGIPFNIQLIGTIQHTSPNLVVE